MHRHHKFLVVSPSWLGDFILSQSLLQVLKHQYPDCQIDMIAPDWSKALVHRISQVDHCLYTRFSRGQLELGRRIAVGKQLKKKQYDQAFVLPNSLKSAIIPAMANIPVRTGWRGEMRYFLLNDIRLLSKRRYPLMLQRYVALAYPPATTLPTQLAYPCLHTNPEQVKASVQQLDLNIPDTQEILAIAPGAAYGPSKRWPVDYFACVIKHQVKKQQQRIWLLGSQQDQCTAQAIMQASTPDVRQHIDDLTGKTSLDQVIDLISRADYVLTNDSGLMHVAAALGKKQVALFGSTSPKHTPPLNRQARTLWLDLPCSPCFQRTCRLKHTNCMLHLMPEQVMRALEQLASTTCNDLKSDTRGRTSKTSNQT